MEANRCLDKRCHVANSDFRTSEKRIADKSVDSQTPNKIDA